MPVTSVRLIQPPAGIAVNDNCQLASVITILVVPVVVGAARSVSNIGSVTLPLLSIISLSFVPNAEPAILNLSESESSIPTVNRGVLLANSNLMSGSVFTPVEVIAIAASQVLCMSSLLFGATVVPIPTLPVKNW